MSFLLISYILQNANHAGRTRLGADMYSNLKRRIDLCTLNLAMLISGTIPRIFVIQSEEYVYISLNWETFFWLSALDSKLWMVFYLWLTAYQFFGHCVKSVQSTLSHLITTAVPRAMLPTFSWSMDYLNTIDIEWIHLGVEFCNLINITPFDFQSWNIPVITISEVPAKRE